MHGDDKMKLHLGCGKNNFDGWVNVDKHSSADIHPDIHADIYDDIVVLKNFEKESVDEIYTSHVVEHITPQDFIKALKRWFEILKQGGVLIIRCPDARLYLKNWLDLSDDERFIESINSAGSLNCVLGFQTKGPGYQNRNLFTEGLLSKYLKFVGFEVDESRKVSCRGGDLLRSLKSGRSDEGVIYEGVPIRDLWCKAIKPSNSVVIS